MHLLALRISSFLDLKPDVVLRHWATAKINQSRLDREERERSGTGGSEENDDDVLCGLIVEKFESLGREVGVGGGEGVSYSEVAKKAWLAGRTRLATKVGSVQARQNFVIMSC